MSDRNFCAPLGSNIGEPHKPIGNQPNVIEASRQQFGLVFIGTNGRVIYYGTP